MKVLYFIAALSFLVITNCREKSSRHQLLPENWLKLTETDTGFIIYNSCDAGNLLLTITDDSRILLHGEQEDTEYDVLSIEDKINELRVLVKSNIDGEKNYFYFKWTNKAKGIGVWQLSKKEDVVFKYSFVVSNMQKTIPVVNQPCKECWGDECDELEDNKN